MWEMMLQGALHVGGPVLAATLAVLLIRRFKPTNGFEHGTTDIEGFYITGLAAIYAVILAFMVFVVWNKYDAAGNNVDAEASMVTDVSRLAQGLPAPYPTTFKNDCRAYSLAVVQDEWPAMAQKKFSRPGRQALNMLWNDLYALNTDKAVDSVVRDHLYERMTQLEDHHRARLRASRTTLPPILWTLLYFGGTLTLFFAAIFHVERVGPHLLKAVALTALIFMALFVIQALDSPFQGFIRIAPDAFNSQTRQWGAGQTTGADPQGGAVMQPIRQKRHGDRVSRR